MQRFRDQIDADEEGYRWLHSWVEDNVGKADRIESSTHTHDGLTTVAWMGNKPIAMFTVLRDMMNWSILICEVFED